MNPVTYALGIAAASLTLVVVAEMLRRRKLRERHAVWWVLAGIVALAIAVFPGLLTAASNLLGVEVPSNLVFFASIAVLFLVCIQHSAELTSVESRMRNVAEHAALLELRVHELEQRSSSGDAS
ncbi:MAG: DUF2304 domain-containing protein [Cryobacterium sp.]|nr:DUF2304 domain-containing protein [Cryobacterium sp.]